MVRASCKRLAAIAGALVIVGALVAMPVPALAGSWLADKLAAAASEDAPAQAPSDQAPAPAASADQIPTDIVVVDGVYMGPTFSVQVPPGWTVDSQDLEDDIQGVSIVDANTFYGVSIQFWPHENYYNGWQGWKETDWSEDGYEVSDIAIGAINWRVARPGENFSGFNTFDAYGQTEAGLFHAYSYDADYSTEGVQQALSTLAVTAADFELPTGPTVATRAFSLELPEGWKVSEARTYSPDTVNLTIIQSDPWIYADFSVYPEGYWWDGPDEARASQEEWVGADKVWDLQAGSFYWIVADETADYEATNGENSYNLYGFANEGDAYVEVYLSGELDFNDPVIVPLLESLSVPPATAGSAPQAASETSGPVTIDSMPEEQVIEAVEAIEATDPAGGAEPVGPVDVAEAVDGAVDQAEQDGTAQDAQSALPAIALLENPEGFSNVWKLVAVYDPVNGNIGEQDMALLESYGYYDLVNIVADYMFQEVQNIDGEVATIGTFAAIDDADFQLLVDDQVVYEGRLENGRLYLLPASTLDVAYEFAAVDEQSVTAYLAALEKNEGMAYSADAPMDEAAFYDDFVGSWQLYSVLNGDLSDALSHDTVLEARGALTDDVRLEIVVGVFQMAIFNESGWTYDNGFWFSGEGYADLFTASDIHYNTWIGTDGLLRLTRVGDESGTVYVFERADF